MADQPLYVWPEKRGNSIKWSGKGHWKRPWPWLWPWPLLWPWPWAEGVLLKTGRKHVGASCVYVSACTFLISGPCRCGHALALRGFAQVVNHSGASAARRDRDSIFCAANYELLMGEFISSALLELAVLLRMLLCCVCHVMPCASWNFVVGGAGGAGAGAAEIEI